MNYPSLEDFLLAAEAILGVPAEKLARAAAIGLAESALAAPQASFGGEEFYPDPHQKAAVLCSRLIRNHPLPDGNKRAGLVLMLDFLDRNGIEWRPPEGGQKELADVIWRLASGDLSEADFTDWLGAHVGEA
jgi:death-on-curing protein